MWVAENDSRAHADELIGEEQAVLEHLLEHQHRPVGLCRDGESDRGEVGGKSRPRSVLDLRHVAPEIVLHHQLLSRWHAHEAVALLDPHTELLERVEDRGEIRVFDAVDRDVAAGDRGEADEAPDLDVIRADIPVAAGERADPFDAEHVRLDPLNPRAE